MTDLAIAWQDTGGDIELAGYDLATDDGLRTAVILSLFTDRRAEPDDLLPDGGQDRRGWWADAWPQVEGDRIGSRLWLLSREKALPAVAQRAREYAEEALAWLVDDGIAAAVRVEAQTQERGVLGIHVSIERPDTGTVEYRFNDLWQSTR